MVGREGGRQLAKLKELQVDLSSFLSFHCEQDLVARENEVSGGPSTNFTVDLSCLLLKIKTPAALPGSNYMMRFKWLLDNDANDLKENVEKQYNSISKSNSLAQPSHFLVHLFIYLFFTSTIRLRREAFLSDILWKMGTCSSIKTIFLFPIWPRTFWKSSIETLAKLRLGKHQDSRENKTNCFPRDLTLSE